MKTLKVAHGITRAYAGSREDPDIKDYKVISVRNSTRYAPGQILTMAEVSDLCEDASWDVVILPLEDKR